MKNIILKNGDTILIRRAEKGDAAALVESVNKICSESDFLTFGQGEFGMTIEQEESFLENINKLSNALYIVAEDNGKIVGNLSFMAGKRPRVAHAGEFSVSVLKEYWGNGIGTELVEYLIEWSKQSGIRKINLRVRTDNSSALGVYRRLGFKDEGTITREIMINGIFYDVLCMGYAID